VTGSAPQVIVLGPPGAGKGTQAARIADHFGLVRINPGQILRSEMSADPAAAQHIRSVMAAGELLPEELIDRIVSERLKRLAPNQGFVLDGYPRSASEAEALRQTLSRLDRLDPRPILVSLEVPHDELVRRLRRRRELEGRADDAEEAIARRLEIHDEHAGAVMRALDGWVDVVRIDGNRPVDAVTDEIIGILSARLASGRSGIRSQSAPG
jgi:adenylate kinase